MGSADERSALKAERDRLNGQISRIDRAIRDLSNELREMSQSGKAGKKQIKWKQDKIQRLRDQRVPLSKELRRVKQDLKAHDPYY